MLFYWFDFKMTEYNNKPRMRQIVLDTETTGIHPAEGHRIIEIGCVELIDRKLTGNTYHQYINPDRIVEDDAIRVHGITNEFLQDKPNFNQVADEFIDFIRDAELVIHNAPFDVGFMDHEFRLCGRNLPKTADICAVLDTLELARKMRPGQKNSLDALCKVYHVNNAHRTYHGALLDSQILADVFLAMTGGQRALALQVESSSSGATNSEDQFANRKMPETKVLYATAEELAIHNEAIKRIEKKAGDNTIWTKVFQ